MAELTETETAFVHRTNERQPITDGHRRIFLHLMPKRAYDERFDADRRHGGLEEYLERFGHTNDRDFIWIGDRPRVVRHAPAVGTVVLVQHEGRHIMLNGGREEDPDLDPGEHHRAIWQRPSRGPLCRYMGFCVGAYHGLRFVNAHHGGFTRAMAAGITRAAWAHPEGLAFFDLPEATIRRFGT